MKSYQYSLGTVAPALFYSSAKDYYDQWAEWGSKIANKWDYKKGRSYTKTKTEKDKMSRPGENHSGIDSRYIKLKIHNKNARGLGTILNYYEARSGIMSHNSGIQGIDDLVYVASRPQVTGTPVTTAAAKPIEGPVKWMDLQVDKKNTGGNIIPQVDGETNDRIYVQNVTLEFDFTNFTSCGQFIDLYICVPKKDIPSANETTCVSTWVDAIEDENYGITTEPIPSQTNAAAVVGSANINHVGMKPTRFRAWNTLWKVLKVKRVSLASAASERLVIHIAHNTILTQERFRDGINCVKNSTVVVMAVHRSALIYNDKDESFGKTTYGPGKIGWSCQKKVQLRPIKYGNRGAANYSTNYMSANIDTDKIKQVNADDAEQVTTQLLP